MKNHSLRLSPAHVAALQSEAERLECISRHGKTAGVPSWRILVQEIAAGKLSVCATRRRKKSSKPPGLRLDPTTPPDWWAPWAKSPVPNVMGLKFALKRSKRTAAELEAAGLIVAPEGGPGNHGLVGGLPGWVGVIATTVPDDTPARPAWWLADSGDCMSLALAEERSGMSRASIEATGMQVVAGVLVPSEEWDDSAENAKELATEPAPTNNDHGKKQ